MYSLSCFQKGATHSGIWIFNSLPWSITNLKNEKTHFKVALKTVLKRALLLLCGWIFHMYRCYVLLTIWLFKCSLHCNIFVFVCLWHVPHPIVLWLQRIYGMRICVCVFIYVCMCFFADHTEARSLSYIARGQALEAFALKLALSWSVSTITPQPPRWTTETLVPHATGSCSFWYYLYITAILPCSHWNYTKCPYKSPGEKLKACNQVPFQSGPKQTCKHSIFICRKVVFRKSLLYLRRAFLRSGSIDRTKTRMSLVERLRR